MKAKDKRLKRQRRLERQRAWMVEFWGQDWQTRRLAYVAGMTIKPGMSRMLRREIRKAKAL
mgnify:CR=1 FL=1